MSMLSSIQLKASPKAIIITTKTSALLTTRPRSRSKRRLPPTWSARRWSVTPTDPTWGSTITVTAQITNQSSGSSPQTRALLSLTPQGLTYGGSTSFGIGNFSRSPARRLPDR